MKTHFRVALALCLALAVPCIATAQVGGRGLLFQVGAGLYFPSYPGSLESDFSDLASLPGMDRIQISLDLALGVPVLERGCYLIARIDGGGDRVDDGNDYIQMNLYLFSLGARYYPYRTGLYVEVGAGASKGVIESSVAASSPSDTGFGYGIAIGYDFNRRQRGFGLSLEAKYDGLTIESEQYGALMFTLNLCWR